MKIGRIEMRNSVAELTSDGWKSENDNLESFLNLTFGKASYSPSHGTFGVKLLNDAAAALGARVVMEPDLGGEDTYELPDDTDETEINEPGTAEKLASFFGLTVKGSDCGANAPGGGGFQPGNSCGSDNEASESEATGDASPHVQKHQDKLAKIAAKFTEKREAVKSEYESAVASATEKKTAAEQEIDAEEAAIDAEREKRLAEIESTYQRKVTEAEDAGDEELERQLNEKYDADQESMDQESNESYAKFETQRERLESQYDAQIEKLDAWLEEKTDALDEKEQEAIEAQIEKSTAEAVVRHEKQTERMQAKHEAEQKKLEEQIEKMRATLEAKQEKEAETIEQQQWKEMEMLT
jgi:hypothetical protein